MPYEPKKKTSPKWVHLPNKDKSCNVRWKIKIAKIKGEPKNSAHVCIRDIFAQNGFANFLEVSIRLWSFVGKFFVWTSVVLFEQVNGQTNVS